jgi:HPt (histidine-containing phosphotransfer) domain-containing protein
LYAKSSGADDCITKPIDFPGLLAAMERLLNPSGELDRIQAPLPNDEKTDSSKPEAFPPIPGLDVNRGLGQVNNMADLYQDVLRSFYTELDGLFGNLPRALMQGRSEETRRKIHTLKGLSGTVGATRLEEISTIINAALKTDLPISSQQIAELQEALQETKKGLAKFIQEKGLL